jgi:hypothetical protein
VLGERFEYLFPLLRILGIRLLSKKHILKLGGIVGGPLIHSLLEELFVYFELVGVDGVVGEGVGKREDLQVPLLLLLVHGVVQAQVLDCIGYKGLIELTGEALALGVIVVVFLDVHFALTNNQISFMRIRVKSNINNEFEFGGFWMKEVIAFFLMENSVKMTGGHLGSGTYYGTADLSEFPRCLGCDAHIVV